MNTRVEDNEEVATVCIRVKFIVCSNILCSMGNLDGNDGSKATEESHFPIILETSVGEVTSNASSNTTRSLRLAMLGCEENPPYGPSDHTGELFLELLRQALIGQCTLLGEVWDVSIAVYRVQLGEYPSNWEVYDGILLPGSFSAAYETDPWIEKLKHVIQEEIVSKQRPTLGICFGHQIIAHSFVGGHAKKYDGGSRGGRFAMATTKAGSQLFGNRDDVELYYTHGDMVEKLPSCAFALGGESDFNLPVQCAAYFKDETQAQQFEAGNGSVRPYAITFQAHPEYAVSRELGLNFTFGRILELMEKKDLMSAASTLAAKADSDIKFDTVHAHSKNALIASAKALGWFS